MLQSSTKIIKLEKTWHAYTVILMCIAVVDLAQTHLAMVFGKKFAHNLLYF